MQGTDCSDKPVHQGKPEAWGGHRSRPGINSPSRNN